MCDLGRVDGQQVLRVVEGERDFGGVQRPAAARAVEDHVGHFVAAEALDALLAQDPLDGVDDVRFSRAVRPHHDRDARRKLEPGAVGKTLETDDFQGLEHGAMAVDDPCTHCRRMLPTVNGLTFYQRIPSSCRISRRNRRRRPISRRTCRRQPPPLCYCRPPLLENRSGDGLAGVALAAFGLSPRPCRLLPLRRLLASGKPVVGPAGLGQGVDLETGRQARRSSWPLPGPAPRRDTFRPVRRPPGSRRPPASRRSASGRRRRRNTCSRRFRRRRGW